MKSNPFQRILVPTDLTDFSRLALQYAFYFQKQIGSEITLIHATGLTAAFVPDYELGYYFENATRTKRHATELFHNYVKRNVRDLTRVSTLVVEDLPARAVVITADDVRADLIIMATHGRHGVQRALLGSVTERVLRDTDRAVLTVAPHLFPVDALPEFHSILCPVNFTDVARQSLEQATELAATFGADLLVLHVSEHGTSRPDHVEATFRDWIDRIVRGRVRYHQIVEAGHPAERVLEVAEQTVADLIVIGAQHKRFSDSTVIGTTTERITRFARQPVLTVIRRTTSVLQEATPEEVAATA